MRAKLSNRLRDGILGLACAAGLILPALAQAESAQDFYSHTRTINFYIALGPGSGDDVWARLVGKYMSLHMPGKPTFVVTEMPGAGSLVLANYIYNQAPKDGTALGNIAPSLPAQVLVGLPNARFDPTKLSYVGSPESSDHACIVMSSSGIKTIDDARKHEVLMGGNGPTSLNSNMPPILDKFLGTKFKVIEGYKSVPEVFLAMERGEVMGQCSRLDTVLRGEADKIKSGEMTLLFTLNEKRTLPNVPSVFEFIKDDQQRQTMQFLRSSTAFGRPYVAPPGVPADRLALLRKAFEDTMKDPAFIAAAAKAKLTVTLTTGEALHDLALQLYKTPKSVTDQAKFLLPGGGH
ncbi:MAG TPA: tripartite tricarboxylate transporter substrate-binding protein [Stellaceae bacterium]|nr:tripartite tricarboxylate transporter substrate-binding protein [Stellaceae bacterium]